MKRKIIKRSRFCYINLIKLTSADYFQDCLTTDVPFKVVCNRTLRLISKCAKKYEILCHGNDIKKKKKTF